MKKWVGLLGIALSVPAGAWTLVASNLAGWQTMPLSIHVNPTNCPISSSSLRSFVQRAIDQWNGIATSSLVLSLDSTDATIDWTTFQAGTATSQVPAVFCDTNFSTNQSANGNGVPASTRLGTANPLAYGAIVLNAEVGMAANIGNLSTGSLDVIFAHEMGHLMGLGHSNVANALMYYSVNGKTTAVVTQDERDGIAYLYPRHEFTSQPFGCGAVHRENSFAAATPFLWFFGVLILLCLPMSRLFRPARLL